MILEFDLNIKPDVPTRSGHVYPKTLLTNAMKEAAVNQIPVTFDFNNDVNVDIRTVAGNVTGYNEDTNVVIVDIADTPMGRVVDGLKKIPTVTLGFTFSSFCETELDGETIKVMHPMCGHLLRVDKAELSDTVKAKKEDEV